MPELDLSTIIVGALTLLGVFVAKSYDRKGQRSQERQKAAADELTARDNEFDRLVALNGRLEAENVRNMARADRAEAELDRERAGRNDDREECRVVQSKTVEALATVAAALRDEVAGELAKQNLEAARKHQAEH